MLWVILLEKGFVMPDKKTLLQVVEQSPAAVAVHDKNAWMSIFAPLHVVEDPVGSTPHVGGIYDGRSGVRGHGALSRFYDTFIAPNSIAFDVAEDFVCGQEVMRDLQINLSMSGKVSAVVPMHLLYELQQDQDGWKITRLAAHWELIPMVMQLLKKGLPAVPVLASLTWRMLKQQGVLGTLGFSKAAFSIGKKGKQLAQDFVAACQRQDLPMLMALMSNDDANIQLPWCEQPLRASELFEKASVSVVLDATKIIAAGDTVSATATLNHEGKAYPCVLLLEVNRKRKRIHRVKFYCEAGL